MTNPIMNLHEHTDLRLRSYRNQTFKILTHQSLQSFLSAFHGPRVRLLSWNHFEANPVTYPRQDVFWGDKKGGEIIGAWVALENIHAKAGRLFVSPFSHTIDVPELARERMIVMEELYPTDASYRRLILQLMDEGIFTCKAPCLRTGDVIFWDSRTVHGSLATDEPRYSRSSFTAHFEAATVPSREDRSVNGVEILKEYFVFRTSMWKIPAYFGDSSGVGGSLAYLLSFTESLHLCHAPRPGCGCSGANKGTPSKLPWKPDSRSQRLFSANEPQSTSGLQTTYQAIRQQTYKGSVSSKSSSSRRSAGGGNCRVVREVLK